MGEYAHCSREDLAGGIAQHPETQCYPHRLAGDCKCGKQHGPAAEVRELGEARGARTVATYDYRDPNGELLFQVVRREPKTFRQRKPDGAGGWEWSLEGVRQVPYRLPEVIAAVEAGDRTYIVEGEKDVEALRAAGCVATCNAGGAGKWRDEFAAHFRGADVVIVRDKDQPGNEHARKVFASLKDVAKPLRVVEARTGKDAADHLAAKHTVDEFVPVYPAEDLRLIDPVAWKRSAVRMSLDATEPIRPVDLGALAHIPPTPTWPTGLEGISSILTGFRGVTILAGAPSSGKTYLAVASASQTVRAGWDVLYLSAEMSDAVLAARFRAYWRGDWPESLVLIEVGFGADLEHMIELIEKRVSARRLLVVIDSLSSFVDQAAEIDSEDVHKIGPLKRTVMWAVNVRRRTDAEISFLLLSEVNAAGLTKGRFGDHKADLVVSMLKDEKEPRVKHISVVKAWESEVGPVGSYVLQHHDARLVRVE